MERSNTIEPNKLTAEIHKRYENQWVAISEGTQIVAAGRTYAETVQKVEDPARVILLKIPPLDQALAPAGA